MSSRDSDLRARAIEAWRNAGVPDSTIVKWLDQLDDHQIFQRIAELEASAPATVAG